MRHDNERQTSAMTDAASGQMLRALLVRAFRLSPFCTSVQNQNSGRLMGADTGLPNQGSSIYKIPAREGAGTNTHEQILRNGEIMICGR